MQLIWIGVLVVSFFLSSPLFAFPGRFGVSPDNATELLLSTLRSGKEKILVNIYQFENEVIAHELIQQILRGVTVQLLVEGTPVGNLSPEGKKVISQLIKAMRASKNTKNRLWLMTGEKNNGKRRYRWNHAKYVVVDGKTLFVSSENFSDSGHPQVGQIGNRGWGVVVESPELAWKVKKIFEEDTVSEFKDLVEFFPGQFFRNRTSAHSSIEESRIIFNFSPIARPRQCSRTAARVIPAVPEEAGEIRSAKIISAPGALKSLQEFIRSAKKELMVEQMSLPSVWRDLEQRTWRSPLVNEMIAAADRGVQVRVLLNDERVFSNSLSALSSSGQGAGDEKLKPNATTILFLREMAHCYQLPIAAEMVNVKKLQITYIHNKGLLVDGKRALVSSINGTQNSIVANRELALWLESDQAASYYGRVFDFDWENSQGNPFLLEATHLRIDQRDCPPRHESAEFRFSDFRNSLINGLNNRATD